MDQLSLLPGDDRTHREARSRARRTDPSTSHAAARELVESGALSDQKRRVLEALKSHPGLCSDELAAEAGLDRYMVARRLPDLERDRLVRKGVKKESTVSGRTGVTWWVN